MAEAEYGSALSDLIKIVARVACSGFMPVHDSFVPDVTSYNELQMCCRSDEVFRIEGIGVDQVVQDGINR